MNATDTKVRSTTVPTLRGLLAAWMFAALALPIARAEDVLLLALTPDRSHFTNIAIVITVPDGWDGRDYNRFYYHAAPDKTVWFTAQIFAEKLSPKQLADWLPGHWKEFGIKTVVDFSKLQGAKAHVGGRPATEYAMEGTFSYAGDIENANGRMGMSVVEIEGGTLVFTWGGKPAKCDEHLDAIVKAMNSIRKKTELGKR